MKRILIVDDNEENLYLLRALLKGHGYEAEQARNGSEALVKTLSNMYDMIISDILMPVIDGFTLCRIIKTDERMKKIPFIFYTATYTDPRDERLALNMGADAFFVKPAEPEEFMRRINDILEAKKNGKLNTPQKSVPSDEVVVLKEYNEALVRKLEHKMLSLEQTNKTLEIEIAARKKAEEKITGALQEKDALLKEIHHRVKNNMQIISSMISLQLNTNIKAMNVDEIFAVARELQNRIKTMALVHEMLYKSKSLSRIDFNEYVHSLVESLFIAFHVKNDLIKATFDITDKPISITTAIPLGLIINELLTNALKYAFPSQKEGEIQIKMTIDDEDMTDLIVCDNGIGLPENFDADSTGSFGMRLISLLTKQLGGTMKMYNQNGATFTIQFRIRNDTAMTLLDRK